MPGWLKIVGALLMIPLIIIIYSEDHRRRKNAFRK
jgi:hypothetical protein